jgi:hypothetical protein
MYIHRNTNTIYQWCCKSWSLRQLVQPLFSWFSPSFLYMDRVLFFRHRSWTWTETYSFEQVTSQTRCLMSQWDFSCESKSDECVRQYNPPTDCVWWWRWCAIFQLPCDANPSVFVSRKSTPKRTTKSPPDLVSPVMCHSVEYVLGVY